jgi:hypothetical protein
MGELVTPHNPISLVRSDEFGDHVERRGLQATDCAKSNILPWPFSAPPPGAGNHHSFLPELQVLGLPPVAVAAKLECQPIQWQTSSSPTPRDFNLSLIRDKLLPPLVLLLARDFFMLGPETVVGTSDRVWPRKIKAAGGEERKMRGFRGRIWRSLKAGVPHWASMRSFGTAPVQDLQ